MGTVIIFWQISLLRKKLKELWQQTSCCASNEVWSDSKEGLWLFWFKIKRWITLSTWCAHGCVGLWISIILILYFQIKLCIISTSRLICIIYLVQPKEPYWVMNTSVRPKVLKLENISLESYICVSRLTIKNLFYMCLLKIPNLLSCGVTKGF